KKPVAILTVARPTPSPAVPFTYGDSSERRNDSVLPPFLIAGSLGGPTDPTGGGPGGPGGSGTSVPVNPGGGTGGGGGGDGRAWGPLATVFAAVGFKPPTFPPLGLGPTLVTTTGAVATAMAFGMFGR